MGMLQKYACGCEMVSKSYCPEAKALWDEIQREWIAAGKPANNTDEYRKLTAKWDDHFNSQPQPLVAFACGRSNVRADR